MKPNRTTYCLFGRDILPLVDDGEWHAAEALLLKMAAGIPPEAALHRAAIEGEICPDLDSTIRWGRRRVAKIKLNNAYYTKLLERRGQPGGHEYRVTQRGRETGLRQKGVLERAK